MCEGSLFFTSSPTLVIYGFYDSHFYKCEMISHCGFDLRFPGLPWWLSDNEYTCQCWSHRFSLWVGERNSKPFQYFGWENPMVRGAWQTIVLGVTKSQTRLCNWACTIIATLNVLSCMCWMSSCPLYKNIYSNLLSIFNHIGFLFILNCMSCLYILDINPSLVISLANIFSDSACCLFALSVISFGVQKLLEGFPGGSAGKESTCNVVDLGSIPGLGKCPREGNGCPLQYSGLENSMDCIVHEVAKNRTQLSDFHFHFQVPFDLFLPLFPLS